MRRPRHPGSMPHATVENPAAVAADSMAAATTAPRGFFSVSAVQACRFGSPDMGIGESPCGVGVSTGEATGEPRAVAGVAAFGEALVSAVPAIGTNLFGNRLEEYSRIACKHGRRSASS